MHDIFLRFGRGLVFPATAALVLAVGLSGCQQTTQTASQGSPGSSVISTKAGESQTQATAEGIFTQPLPDIKGPKRTVAVGKFDAIGAFTENYGDWDIGGGLAAMLTSALVESGRFIVLERAELGQVINEQELKAGGVTNPDTGPQLGKVTGVQLLVYGAVTEFGAEDEGGGISIGGSGGGLGNLLSGALSSQSSSGKVAMDVRVVDTTTGEIIEVHRVSEKVSSSGFDLSLGYRGISLGGNKFWKTPLGEATRSAINRTVRHIAVDAQGRPWTGQVIEFDGNELYINAGQRAGLNAGDMFMIERVVKTFTDPSSGQVLGTRRKELGVLQLTGVEQKLAFGSFSPLE